MKVLFLSNLAVSQGGGGVFSQSILKALKNNNDVDVMYMQNRRGCFWKLKAFSNMLLGLVVFALPFRVAYYFNLDLLIKIRKNKRKYDVFVVDHLECAWIFTSGFINPDKVIFVSHNDEVHLWKERLNNADVPFSGIFKLLIEFDLGRFSAFQKKAFQNSRGVINISSDLADLCVGKSLRLPPFFNYQKFEIGNIDSRKGKKITLGFLGNLHWWPNKKGLIDFVRNVYPSVVDYYDLNIYGFGCDEVSELAGFNGVNLKGYVSDLNDVWRNVDLMIVPIEEGAGANVKFAEILYNRMPVVTSCFVFSQYKLFVDSSIGVYVCANTNEWIDKLKLLAKNGFSRPCGDYLENFDFDFAEKNIMNFLREIK